MGISMLARCSGYYSGPSQPPTVINNTTIVKKEYVSVNPDPTKFEILSIIEFNNTYAEIRYPNCTTFEGIKVLVFEGKVATLLRASKEIDPHFDNAGKLAPLARFEPTLLGRTLAMHIAKMPFGR